MTEIPAEVMEQARITLTTAISVARAKTADQAIEIVAQALLARDKRAAEIARGQIYFTRYRTWPWWKFPDGSCTNMCNESDIVRHADRIATAILTYDATSQEGGADE